MTITSASTFIACAPSTVRKTFLDWPNITAFDTSYMTSLTPLSPTSPSGTQVTAQNPRIPHPTKKTGEDVAKGDKVHGTFWGGEAELEILENTETVLRWRGQWKGMFAIRSFSYGEVEGGTRFTQSEEATGVMGAILVVDRWAGNNLKKKFEVFNEDLKFFCEKGRKREVGKK